MKHTEETKRKISETLKRKGIKPTVLPSREQCMENLKKAQSMPVWNKGKKGLFPAWNVGLSGYMAGSKNGMWKGGKPKCIDCGSPLSSYKAERCCDCSHKRMKGEGHPSWKGGAGQPFRRTGEYKNWRLNVYRRDWYTCQFPGCGYKGRDLEAHHIFPCRNNEELVYDIKNGITLCKECHKKTRYKEDYYSKMFRAIVESHYAISTTAPKGITIVLGFSLP